MSQARGMLTALRLGLVICAMLTFGCQRTDPTQQLDSSGSPGCRYGELTELADGYGTDKGTAGHGFTDFYEQLFLEKKYSARKIFEIGVLRGASLKMLRDFFPAATIYGVDIEDTSELDSDRIKTFVADQSDREQLEAFIDAHGSDFDIIIDDGGHTMEQQQVSFGYLFPHVKPGGYYIIEDVHTSWFGAESGAEPDGKNTTMTMIANFLENDVIESQYMTPEEARYATDRIRYCEVYFGRSGKRSGWKPPTACVFRKK